MRKKAAKSALKGGLNFISEAGMLKSLMRSGWSVLGIKSAESVAEHAFRCVVIGYVLAHMEKADVYKVLLMSLFNDIQEARIGDLHKMAQRYLNIQPAEDKAFIEQIAFLPRQMKKELALMRKDYKEQRTKESIVARDADILECLLQAKEYREYGFCQAAKFMQQAPRFLKTKAAQALWHLAKKTELNDWWRGLSQFKR